MYRSKKKLRQKTQRERALRSTSNRVVRNSTSDSWVQAKSSEELRGTFSSFKSDAPATHTAGALSAQKCKRCCKQHQTTDLAPDNLCTSHQHTWLIQQMNSIAQIWQTIHRIFAYQLQRKRNPATRTFKPGSWWWLFTKAIFLPQTLVLSLTEASCLPLTLTFYFRRLKLPGKDLVFFLHSKPAQSVPSNDRQRKWHQWANP